MQLFSVVERFSNDCRKNNTKPIAPTNHNRSKHRGEPILRVPSNYQCLVQSAGKNRSYTVWLLLVLFLIDWQTGGRFFSQSLSVTIAIAQLLSTVVWKPAVCILIWFIVLLGMQMFLLALLTSLMYWTKDVFTSIWTMERLVEIFLRNEFLLKHFPLSPIFGALIEFRDNRCKLDFCRTRWIIIIIAVVI